MALGDGLAPLLVLGGDSLADELVGALGLGGLGGAGLGRGGPAIGLGDEELLAVDGRLALLARNRLPGALAREAARLHVVGELQLHVALHDALARRVEDGVGDLDAALGVPRHHVGAGEVDGVGLHAEGVDARVLEQASHYLAHVDAGGAALNAGDEAADASDDHDDLDAGLACLGEAVDDVAVGERVHLEEDTGGLAGLGARDFAVDAAHDERLQAQGRDAEVAVGAAQVAQREVAEEGVAVLGDAGVGGDEHEVAVQARGLLVEVAGAQAGDAGKSARVVVGDLADLGVALEALGAVDDGAAGLLEALGPLDVVLLVEAGAQLHEDGDLLAVLGGVDEALAQARVARHAVERDLDRDAVVVVGGLADEVEQRAHRLIGIGEQHVVVHDLGAHGAALIDHGARLRVEGREGEGAAAVGRDLVLERVDEAEVGWGGEAKDPTLLQAELLAHEGDELLVQRAGELEAHGLQAAPALEDLLHVLAVVLLFLHALAVGVDVGVARDADDGRARGHVGAEAAAEHGGDDVFCERVAHTALAGGQPYDAAGRGRHLNHAEKALLVIAVERADHVEQAVLEVGEGVARVDDERAQDGGERRLEVARDRDEVGVGVVLGRHALDALGGQRPLELGEAALAALVEAGQHPEQVVELLGGRLVRLVVGRLALEDGEIGQAADTDHEPLVHVGLEDGAELDALDERHGGVKGLVEHAVVEAEPADLAVLRVGVVTRGVVRALAELLLGDADGL